MTDKAELAVIPPTTLAIEPGESNIERCRLLYRARRLVDLEFALRVKAELDGPGSKTQQIVADEIGCSRWTISESQHLLESGERRSRSVDVGMPTNRDLDRIDRHFERIQSMEFDDPEELPDDDSYELDHDAPVDDVPQDSVPGEVIWSEREARLLEKLKNGEAVVVNMRASGDPNLWRWAQENGMAIKVDRSSEWGNPFEMPADGNRHTVILNYEQYYLPHKPSLLERIPQLRGKALGCWCAPEPCHGDVLREKAGQ